MPENEVAEIAETGVASSSTSAASQSPSTSSSAALANDDPFFASELSRTADAADKPATPSSPPAKGRGRSAAAPSTPADEPAASPAAPLGADVVDALTEARLPVVPNETREGALQRLYAHERGKSGRFYADFRATRDDARRATEAAQQANDTAAQLREMLSPMLQSFRDAEVARQREAFVATIPDREVDPDGWQRWATEQLLQRDLQREQRDAAAADEAQRQAMEERQLSALTDVDDQALTALEESLQADDETRQAYAFANQMAYRGLQSRYPTASHAQLVQGVELMHQLEVRGAWNAGIHPADLFKATLANARALLGGAVNGNGNDGNGHVAQPQAQQPTAPRPTSASPTAQRMAQQSQQAAARRVVSPPPNGASPPPAGDVVDMSQWDEDAIMDYVLASPANMDAWKRWQSSQYGKSSWRYGD